MKRITEILKKVGSSRNSLRQFAMLVTSTAFAGMLLLLLSSGSGSTIQAQTSSTSRTTTITSALDGHPQTGEYGYEYDSDPTDRLGEITDRSFEFSGTTYHIDKLTWDAGEDEIEIDIDKCLKLSDVVSITIGTQTFSNSDIDWEEEEDSECVTDSNDDQGFEINGVTVNPLPLGSVQVTFNLGQTTPWTTTNPWTTHVDAVQEAGGDDYGYEFDEFGSIDDRSFWYDGKTYRIERIVWDDSGEVQIEFDKCLKSSDLVSLQIGSNSYMVSSLDSNDIDRSDSDCDSSPRWDQELAFEENSNPLTSARETITLTFRGSSTTPPTAAPTVAPTAAPTTTPSGCDVQNLSTSAISGLKTVTDTWGASCDGHSVNVPSGIQSQTYSRFHKFNISQKAVVEITLDSSNLTYPYLFLMKGEANNRRSYLDGKAIGTDKSRIVSELNPGTYTIESTAQTRRNFTLNVKVSNCGAADSLGAVLNNNRKSDDSSYSRRWTGTCLSSPSDRIGKQASFHSFTLKRSAVVRIDLTASGREPNPILLVGTGISNSVVNPDSSVSKDDTAYRVYDELSAGTYTIEAVANSGENAGSFTLSLEALALNVQPTKGLVTTKWARHNISSSQVFETKAQQLFFQYSPTGIGRVPGSGVREKVGWHK